MAARTERARRPPGAYPGAATEHDAGRLRERSVASLERLDADAQRRRKRRHRRLGETAQVDHQIGGGDLLGSDECEALIRLAGFREGHLAHVQGAEVDAQETSEHGWLELEEERERQVR